MASLTLADVRKKYPQASDLTDDQLLEVVAKQYGASVDEMKSVLGYEAPAPRSRTWGDVASDALVTATKSAVGLPQAFVGLIDIPTGGRVGKALEEVGYRPNETQNMLSDMYSDPQKAANKQVNDAQGFTDTALAYIKNPSTIATTVGESAGQMLGGAGAARKLISLFPKLAPWAAGAIGEGLMGAGSAEEQLRAESPDGLTTAKQGAAALASGAGTALFGAAGGKIANSKLGQKLGIADIDTMLASGATMPKTVGFLKAAATSGISEGALEEMPQSAWEQMMQNYAQDKPILDGVDKAMASGFIAGAAMGGGAGGFNSLMAKEAPLPKIEPPKSIMDQTDIDSVISAAESSVTQAPVVQKAATPIDDPMRLEVINQLPEQFRDAAIRAYNIITDEEAPKGIKKQNQKLLDDILEQASSMMQPQIEDAPKLDQPTQVAPIADTAPAVGNSSIDQELEKYISEEQAKENTRVLSDIENTDSRVAFAQEQAIATKRNEIIDQILSSDAAVGMRPAKLADMVKASMASQGYANPILNDSEFARIKRFTDIAKAEPVVDTTSQDNLEGQAPSSSLSELVPEKKVNASQSDAKIATTLPENLIDVATQAKTPTEFFKALNGLKIPLGQRPPLMAAFKEYKKAEAANAIESTAIPESTPVQESAVINTPIPESQSVDQPSSSVNDASKQELQNSVSSITPTAIPATAIPETTLKDNGALSIKGDTKVLQTQLKEAGIPSLPSRDGVTVGAKNVEKAQEFIASMETASQVEESRPVPKSNETQGNENQISTKMGGSTLSIDLGKPAWMATQDEVKEAVSAKGFSQGRDWSNAHLEAVQKAYNEGKQLPEKVLYENRWLMRPESMTDTQHDNAVDVMVDTFRKTDDYSKAIDAYKEYAKENVSMPVEPTVAVSNPETQKINKDSSLADGTTIKDGEGNEYRVHYQRNNLVIAHPIIDGKAQVNADTTVRFWVNENSTPSGENDRIDPIFKAETSLKVSNPAQQTAAKKGMELPYKKGKTGAETARNRLAYENPFLSFLATHGVSILDRSDVGGEKGRPKLIAGHGPLFRKNGLRLDELAQLAAEKGFLTKAQIESENDNGGVNALSDMINSVMRNEVVTTVKDVADNRQADEQLQEEAYSLGIDITGKTGDEVYDLVQEYHREKGYQEAVDLLNELSEESKEVSKRNNLQELEFQIEEVNNEKASVSRGQSEDSSDAAGGTRETIESSQSTVETPTKPAQESDAGGGDQGFRLTGETAQEASARLAKEDSDAKANESETAKQDEADRKARIKKEIDSRQESSAENFQLGQSAEDSLSGQRDIFADNQTEAAKEQIHESDLTPAEKLANIAAVNRGDISPDDIAKVLGQDRTLYSKQSKNLSSLDDSADTVPKKISKLLEMRKSGENFTGSVKLMPVATEAVSEAAKQGLDIEGYSHAIDGSAVAHVLKNHGNQKVESARGQLAISEDDFLKIPDIINNPDTVAYGLENKIGRDMIAYIKKNDDGSLLYLEEVRTGKKTLTMQSMRKYPSTTNATAVMQSLRPTSKTLTGNEISIVESPDARNGKIPSDSDSNYSKSNANEANTDNGLGDVKIVPAVIVEKNVKSILAEEGAVQVNVSGGNVDALKQIAERFGKKIVFFREVETDRSQNKGVGLSTGSTQSKSSANEGSDSAQAENGRDEITNGFVTPRQPNLVFLNADGSNHLLYILGHELGHSLKIDDRKLWAEMASQLQPLVRKFGKYREEYGQGLTKDVDVLEELVSDVIGDNFLNNEFWQDMAKQSQSLFKRIANKAIALLNKSIRLMVGRDVSIFISDMEKARSIIAETMLKYVDGVSKGRYESFVSDVSGTKRSTSKIGAANPHSWNAPEPSRFDDLLYKYQDKQIDTKRVIDSIDKNIADDLNVYQKEELFHNRAASRVKEFINKEQRPLLKSMKELGIDMPTLEEYLHARTAEETNILIAWRNRDTGILKDGGSGMKTADARKYLASLDPALRKNLESLAAKVDAITEETRQLYVDYGLESKDTVDGWRDMFDHYVPLMREQEGETHGMGVGQGFSVKGKEVKGRTGSTRKVVDIFANIAMQREKIIVRGEKNKVAKALLDLATATPNPDFWSVDKPETKRVYDPDTDSVKEQSDPLFKSRENVIVAKVQGAKGKIEEKAIIFNETNARAMRMVTALKNLDTANMNGFMGGMAKITRYFSAINTQYNPIFGVVNLTRDLQGAMVNLTSTPLKDQKAQVAKHTLSALKAIYLDERAGKKGNQIDSEMAALWREFELEGGPTGYREMFANSADRAEAIENELNPTKWMDSPLGKVFTANGMLKVPLAQAQKQAKGLFGVLEDYNNAMENSVRLAAYKVAKDQGLSKEKAASLAKNLTVNFNRKGQVAQQVGALYAFFNASMQGTARHAKTLFTIENGDITTTRLSSTGKKIVYGGVLIGVVQALLLAAAGFDDDEPPQFVRERSLIIPTGWTGLTPEKGYVNIPMPLGLHILPNIGRISSEFALGGFKRPADKVFKLIGLTVDAFNPTGGGASFAQAISFTVTDPIIALAENKDWTGKPIAKTSHNKALPGHALMKDTASYPSKVISEGINYLTGGTQYTAGAFSPTPDQIDYLAGQATGGVGREVSKTMQTLSALYTGEDLPINKVPLVGRFYGSAETQSAQANRFYSNLDRLNEHETEIKGMMKDRKGLEVARYLRDNPEARMFEAANEVERSVQKLRQVKRDLLKSGAESGRIKMIDAQITSQITRFNSSLDALRKHAN